MVHPQKIAQADACAFLSQFQLIDPEGCATVSGVCHAGQCFALTFASGRLVYVLEMIGPALWITAAAGNTTSATALTLATVEAQAHAMGAQLVKFQTVRNGLIRLAQRAGYSRAGFVLSKAIK